MDHDDAQEREMQAHIWVRADPETLDYTFPVGVVVFDGRCEGLWTACGIRTSRTSSCWGC